MKLLTHNMLMSPGTRNGYPLAIEVEKMEEVEAEFNAEFMARMVDKIDYGALLKTVSHIVTQVNLGIVKQATFESESFGSAVALDPCRCEIHNFLTHIHSMNCMKRLQIVRSAWKHRHVRTVIFCCS